MSSSVGNRLRLTIFGESHGPAIGGVIEGLPPGEPVDWAGVRKEMARRAPGRDPAATQRSETDEPRVLSGLYEGRTAGTPLAFVIENADTRSKDYSQFAELPRPSHADYTARVKYGGFADMRGGGHFSGRLTAPMVFAGALARQILSRKGITVGGHILRAGTAEDRPFDPVNVTAEELRRLSEMRFPVLEPRAEDFMRSQIEQARMDSDSLGGVCEIAAVGLPAGLGGPLFGGAEGLLSTLIFGVPAVKGVEFGAGFELAGMRGFEANDAFLVREGRVETETNRSGGIQGGITNGMPLIFRAVFKPTASVARPQKTVNLREMQPAELQIKGRHDPFIALRGLPVLEAVTAFGLLDLLLDA